MHAWAGPRERDADDPAARRRRPRTTGTAITFRGGPVSESQVVAAIRECYDPEIPINIYDLGPRLRHRHRRVADRDPHDAHLRGLSVGAADPGGREEAASSALGQQNVSVDVVFDPPWHPARISPDGKAKLGLG